MSISEQIRAMEKLSSIDSVLKVLDDELSGEQGALLRQKETLVALEKKIAEGREDLLAKEKLRGEHLAEIRSMNVQVEHSREKLSRSRTERETNAAQREMEELRKLIRDREAEAERLVGECDAARKTIADAEASRDKVQGELSGTEGNITTKLEQMQQERAAKLAERGEALKALPPQLARRYDMIQKKRGTALAQTTDGTCKACNISLPPQLFHRLRREPGLDQCPSCQRILYFASREPA